MEEKLFLELNEKSSIGRALAHTNAYDDNFCRDKSVGGIGRTFENWDTNISIKSDYDRNDFGYFRSKDDRPTNRRSILNVAQSAYDRVGVVRNVIDLMADFSTKGIKISHHIPHVDKFYKEWSKKVHLVERTERFVNTLYRLGVVAPYRINNTAGIPIRYSFLNPSTLDVVTDNISSFIKKNVYVLTLPDYFYNYVEGLTNEERERVILEITKDLPNNIRDAIIQRRRVIYLDQEMLQVFHYKKDDWQIWGKPVTYSIFDDLVTLEKLKLADISALDGAISNVRLWNIGRLTDNPQTTILPTKGMINKLKNILDQNIGGGTLDLVWGPELTFKETSTEIHKFLGKEKYKPTLDAIFDGLGIPVALRGDVDRAGVTNFISLKTLIERLNYGRNLVVEFWNTELEIIRKKMGFRDSAVIEFDNMVLTDEAAEKQLLINLVDRDIISSDSLREKFNFNSEIEKSKIRRESKKRGKSIPEKASPYHNPEKLHEYKKILLSGGTITPSEFGIKLEEREGKQLSRIEQQMNSIKERKAQVNPNGRPRNIIETEKRDKKQGDDMRMSRSKQFLVWCSEAQSKISDVITKAVLESTNTKNVRSLTGEQKQGLERLKAHCLFNMEPFSELTKHNIFLSFSKKRNSEFVDDINKILSHKNTVEQKRNSLCMLYFLNFNDF